MLYDNPALLSAVAQCLLNINTGFGITSLLKKNPSIRVQIGFIIRFRLHRAVTHLFRLIQMFLIYGKEIRIIIQCSDVVGIIYQRRIICRVRFFRPPFLVINVSQYRIKVGSDLLVALLVDLPYATREYIQRLVQLLLLIISDALIIIKLQCVRMIL